ncbi:MAG: FecR domain-containing protein [Leptonema sp. (in: bacteria)]
MKNKINEDIEKLESLLRSKLEIPTPEWKEELLYKNPIYPLQTNILSSYYKIAAIGFLILSFTFFYFKFTNFDRIKISKTQEQGDKKAIGIVLFVKGDSFFYDQEHPQKLYVGNLIYKNTLIETKENGKVEILLDKKIHIRIERNTKIKLDYQNNQWNLYQEKGISYHDVKLKEKENYYIETPAIIAGVRGTFLKIKNQQNLTEIEVLNGKVAVLRSLEKENNTLKSFIQETVIKENSSIEIQHNNGKILKKDAKKQEMVVTYIEMTKNREIFTEGLWEEIKKMPLTKNKKEIEQVYNKRVEIIKLKDGRILQGIIASQIEDKIILHTTEGILVVNTEDIKEIVYENTQNGIN